VTLDGLGGPFVYLSILAGAVVEGEVVFVLAAAIVGQGHLNPFGVLFAGAAGASLGDQFYFYLLRGRFRRWVDRHEWLARRGQTLVHHVRRHEVPVVLMIRFAPGLRIALAAACAYAGVGRLRFSALSIVASLVWAAGLLVLVAWVGPAYLPALGISGWWSALVPALLIVILFHVGGRLERRVFVDGQRSDEREPIRDLKQ
jgi:membrane protein DedA with SNARE-associated domain